MNCCFLRWDSKMTVADLSTMLVSFLQELVPFRVVSACLSGVQDLVRMMYAAVTVSVRVRSSLSVYFSALFIKGIVAVLMWGLCKTILLVFNLLWIVLFILFLELLAHPKVYLVLLDTCFYYMNLFVTNNYLALG